MSVLVWSYGSNLDPVRMRSRCPSARMEGPLTFDNAALVFRAVADVVHRPGSKVPGGLWEISEADEAALDRFEGVSSGLYERWHVTKMHKGRKRRVLFYKMTETGIMPPSLQYIDTILKGYRAFDLDVSYLEAALAEAHDDRNKTPYLKWRFERDRPRLAQRDHIVTRPKQLILPMESRLIKAADKLERVAPKVEENATDKYIRYLGKRNRHRKRSAKLSRKGW